MRIALQNRRFVVLRVVALLFGLWALHSTPTFGQNGPDRFWLAGRYDGNRVVIYFDAVKFGGTLSSNAREIPNPVATAFFNPVELPATYVARFQKAPTTEHFAIGDRYDLLAGNGTIATIKLTSLVGCETDEQVGNDSFIGALGTIENKDSLDFAKSYYAVRRHQEPQTGGAKLRPKTTADYLKYAHLDEQPVRFDIETRIAELLNKRLKMEATDAERRLADNVPPSFKVQPFRVADGSLRYYVRAEWKSGKDPKDTPPYVLAAWMTPRPLLHILAVQKRTSPYDSFDDDLPGRCLSRFLRRGGTPCLAGFSAVRTATVHQTSFPDFIDLLSHKIPDFPITGLSLECPSCKKISVYKRRQLIYRAS